MTDLASRGKVIELTSISADIFAACTSDAGEVRSYEYDTAGQVSALNARHGGLAVKYCPSHAGYSITAATR